MCSCSHVMVGGQRTDNKNWNPDCETHGTKSEWYNSPTQKEKRKERSERLRELQLRAGEARRNART